MRINQNRLLLWCSTPFWGVLWIALLVGCQGGGLPIAEPTPTRLTMQQFDTDAPITLLYPADWHFMLPREGMLLFGEEKVLIESEPGALFTVLRVPNRAVHGNLEGELNHYLDFGPRRDDYVEVDGIHEIMMDGLAGLAVRMNFAGEGDRIAYDANITAVETESGAVYIFAETAPSDVWAEYEPRFSLIRGSIQFKE